MAKKSSSGKKSFSQDDNYSDVSTLYGQVNALAPSEPSTAAKPRGFSRQTESDDSERCESYFSSAANPSARQQGTYAESASIKAPSAASSVNKVYQHWADGDADRGTQAEWNNNILSDAKSNYFEGEVVPHVFYYKAGNSTPLVNGQSYAFNLTYNYYQANTNAGGFLFMTTPDLDRSPTAFNGTVALADSDGFSNSGGMQGNFKTVNANITAVSDVTYTTQGIGTKDGHVTITFTYTGPTTKNGGAEIHYGLMIASPGDVPDQGRGMTHGASDWTGGSLQTTVDVNGKGAMSIQLMASAIIEGEISGMKFNDLDGNGVRDADGADNLIGTADDEAGLAGWRIFLDQDKDGLLDAGERSTLTDNMGYYSFSVIPDADPSDSDNDAYRVREVQQTGWVQTTANPKDIVITACHPQVCHVDFGNQQLMPALNIVKDASVPGGTANVVGEIITYTITVQNTGNQILTGVTVTDPKISDLMLVMDPASSDGELGVGETWTWMGTHVVTQADIDAGGDIVNLATADSDQTGPDTDGASIPVEQAPSLNITKDATVPGGTANAAGEVIGYTIAVQNTGNQTLTGVTVSDPFISDLTLVVSEATADGELDVGETWSYTATHVVLQSEIDTGGEIVNLATADSDQTGPDTDGASIPVEQTPGMNITKDATVPGGTANAAGEVIGYTIAVQNTGNQTLTGVIVSDPFISDLTLVDSEATADGELDVGETWSYTATHVVLQSEIDAGGDIVNLATADSDQTGPDTDGASIPVEQTPGLNITKDAIVPGGTANAAGEVIGYTISVQNTGNQTLTGVTVSDPFISDLTLVVSEATADGELDVGETWSYTATHVVLQSEIDAGSDIVNLATADSDQTGPDTDGASIPVEQTPGLNITKDATVPGGTANAAGEVVSYTIAVQNTGNQTLTGVTVTDPFISDLTLVDSEATADGELDVGETWSYTATHVVLQSEIDAGGEIVNLATADSDQTGPDTDGASIPVEQAPSLNITKDATVPGGTANAAGEVVSYTIAVQNTGNQTLTGVIVSDPFISDLTLVNSAATADGELDVGETWSYTATHVVLQSEIDAGGDIVNLATADSDQTGPDTDGASIPVEQTPGLNITKDATVPGGTANAAGEVVSYTIAVQNTGNQTMTGVTVTDPFISDLTLVDSEATADGELDVGETWSYTATHVVLQSEIDAGGEIVNLATADSDQTGPDTDGASIPVEQTPGLNITKDAIVPGGTANAAGEVIGYTIAVQNTGNQTLTGVTVTDPFISDLTLVDSEATADGELDVGETWSYTATHVVLQSEIDAGGDIVNLATADSDQTGPDTDGASIPVEQAPSLNITKDATVPGGTANAAGEVVSYTIAVQNTGNQTLTGVTVTDPFISDLTLVDSEATADGELDVGETWSYTATHVVLQSEIDAGGDIVNLATADSDQTGPDTDGASIPVSQAPSLNITKDAAVAGGTANAAGEVIGYTIAVQNTGNQTLTGVTVADPFISDLTLVDSAATADGELDVGETWSYTATHVVLQSEIDAGGDIVNLATADSDQTGPDTDGASIPVEQAPSLNITKDATVPGGTANAAGEVVSYTIAVQNTGNQTLTGVTVSDPFISDLTLVDSAATADGELDVGETWGYTATHTVSQAEIDAGSDIVNLATADSDQTGPDTDGASIPVSQAPSLNITKDATVPGGSANAAGEVVSYTIAVQNTGNQTLTGVIVSDPFISDLTLVVSEATADGELDVGETWNYTGSHTVTLAEMDSGADIVNTATADSNQTDPDTDDASVPVSQSPAIAIDKAIIGVNGGNGNGTLDAVNDIIRYAIIVSNTGNITLTDVTVTDPFTNLTITGETLAPGANATYLTSYTLTQNDLDSNGGGDGFIENTATADSLETSTVSDTEALEIIGLKALNINKSLNNITEGNGNQVADAANDVLNYLVTVSNLGTLTLTNVSVVDESTGLNESGLTLLPGESKTYETSYTLKQSDLDDNGKGDGYIDNVATADSDQTPAISDNEATPLLRTVGLGVDKNATDIAGGRLFVDAAGQVITYDIRVYNAGSVTLTGVTVTDELTNMNVTIPTLAPGEFQNYITTYTVTQDDLNNNAGGNGIIENITVADSVETTPVSDGEAVPLLARPLLFLNKSFLNVTEGNDNNLADAVGDQLNYLIVLANPGNVTLTDVSVFEPLTNLTLTGLTLAPNATQTYQTSYVLTQADLDNNGDGDGYIDNIAIADSTQTPQISDVESVPILRSIALAFDKEFVNVTGGNGNALADFAGDALNFSFTVTNQGTVTLTNVVVTDAVTGLNQTLASLAPGGQAVFNSSYTLLQSDLDSNGGGDGRVENTATADTDQTLAVTDIEGVAVIYEAKIDLTKYVSVDDGLTWEDANLPTGPSLSSAAGINPLYKYTALNDGTVTLNDLTLSDGDYDLNGGADGKDWDWGDLAPGLTAEFIFEAPFMLGQNSGDALVTATALTPVVDIDNAYYLGV
ncbi:DUF11 domain-containing protein [Limnohabitans sp. 2KL-17]|uniref:DUF7507 domain-containing protein n=1 Tax=Limnohabitans sp. 2KL-17 TaxID=1100704 RepID=UPI001304AF20|nr:DUF11 domain-containing protein [Limnohabitans sp. 2KL-17]